MGWITQLVEHWKWSKKVVASGDSKWWSMTLIIGQSAVKPIKLAQLVRGQVPHQSFFHSKNTTLKCHLIGEPYLSLSTLLLSYCPGRY